MQTVKTSAKTVLCFVAFSVILLGCSKVTSTSPQDQAKTLMTSGSWKLQSSSAGGVDQTALFKNFTITFTSSGFSTTNGEAVWPASGTWNFQGTSATPVTIVRNDGLPVQIEVTSSSLVMSLTWAQSTLGSGRIESTSGQNVFTMIK